MRPTERNPRFTNPLVNSASPYLRQHASNPVFWYPWGREAIDRARLENKPILLSIGYSTCYWCHVMEREIFENLSIASLMNRLFINIKVDREEHPGLDEIYMVARQLLTQEGGWPNNVFLTPDLKPFYAGGTYGLEEMPHRPSFPRLLEWINYSWTTQQQEVKDTANRVVETMRPFLNFTPGDKTVSTSYAAQAKEMMNLLSTHYDARSGGFFQSPKFPHECLLEFLAGYHRYSNDRAPLDMLVHSLEKMAAGGINDHVGCGFHRYAVDKDWLVPHFEKMLYTQAMLAKLYTDASQLAGSDYLADVARSILDFTAGPLRDGQGAFYAAIDAETDEVEGAYYAWTPEQLDELLTDEERAFFVQYFALADIPAFPGHKHPDGQVITLRKPLVDSAREHGLPYASLAAVVAGVMNKLLRVRNERKAPHLDDKIITSWNGLMIEAYANAAKPLNRPDYLARAINAANFLLEYAIDNDGRLKRIYAMGGARLDATLEDYAFLVKGLLAIHRAQPGEQWLDAAVSLTGRADELLRDPAGPGYFFSELDAELPVRLKSGDDSTLPSANAVMMHNLIDLFELTGDADYRVKAEKLAAYFLQGRSPLHTEPATMLLAALRLENLAGKTVEPVPVSVSGAAARIAPKKDEMPADVLRASGSIFPADAKPGELCELILEFDIKEGWHINANRVNQPFLIPLQISLRGDRAQLLEVVYPEPLRRKVLDDEEPVLVYEGLIHVTVRLRLKQGEELIDIPTVIRYQPCKGDVCYPYQDNVLLFERTSV